MIEHLRIINVESNTSKLPVCGERIVDIYSTGDMTVLDFVLEYRKEGMEVESLFVGHFKVAHSQRYTDNSVSLAFR